MQPIDFLFVAYCIYVPFLVLLYLVEIWVIVKPGSPFKSSFYVLFVVTAVGDLIMIACTFHEFRLEFFPLVNGMFENYDCQICTRTRMTISFICPFAQDCLNCFVALNRLTSIMRPYNHETMWKKLLPFSICFSYLLPIAIFTLPGFRTIMFVKIDVHDYVVYLATYDTTYLPWVSFKKNISCVGQPTCYFNGFLVTIVEMCITSIAIVIIYSIAAINLRKFVGSKEMAKQERTLLNFGIINFAIMTPLIFMQILLGFPILPREWMAVMFYQYGWQLDLKFFGASISMIVVNKSFREYLLNSLHLKRSKNGDAMVSVTENRLVQVRN